MGNAPESQVDPNGTVTFLSNGGMQSFGGSRAALMGMMHSVGHYGLDGMPMPGADNWGRKTGPFDGKSWGGLSGAALANYLDGAGADLKSIILSNVYESGSFLVNAGSPGGGGNSDGAASDPQSGGSDSKKSPSEFYQIVGEMFVDGKGVAALGYNTADNKGQFAIAVDGAGIVLYDLDEEFLKATQNC